MSGFASCDPCFFDDLMGSRGVYRSSGLDDKVGPARHCYACQAIDDLEEFAGGGGEV
jgi:hypothetical protein